MDPKNTDEGPSSSFPQPHEGAPDHPPSSSSSLPAADSTLRRTSPPPSSSSSPADSTLRRTSPPPSSSSHPLSPSIIYCNFCDEEFDDFEFLFEHIICKHPGQLGEDKPPSPSPSQASPSIPSPLFNCYDCEEVFRDFQAWLDHSANSHPFEPSRHFLVPGSPEAPAPAAPPEMRAVRLIRCTLCRRTFLPQEVVCQHVRNARARVSAEGMSSTAGLICHLCGQTFSNSDESASHVLDAHRPIIAICAVVLAQRVAGGLHRRSSSSARPREAAAPPRPSFAAVAAAGKGLVHAALQEQEEAAGQRFNCRSCSSSFASGRELTNHVWAAHPPITAMRGRAVPPRQPPGSSGVSGPVVASQAQEAAEPEITDETAAEVEEFLSRLDSGAFLNLEDEQEQPPADG